MSDLATTTDLNSLLPPEMLSSLLEEIEEANKTSSMTYGKEPEFEDVRYLNTTQWQNDKGQFKWSLPGQKEFEEELSNKVSGRVTKLIGYIAHASIGAAPKKWDETKEQYIPACRLIGMKRKNEYVSGILPDFQPLKNMYGWDNNYEGQDSKGQTYIGGYNPNVPDKLVESLGLFGSQNGLCADCIRSGNNVLKVDGEVYLDPKTSKPVYCDINNSYIIFAVTAIETTTIKVDKKDPKKEPEVIVTEYDISEAIEEDCSFVLVKINLAKKSGLSGIWNRETKEREVEGYSTLCATLAKSKDPEIENNPIRRLPPYNEIAISIAEKQPKNYLHFQAFPPNIELLKQVQMTVKEANEKAERIIIPASELEKSNTTTLSSDNVSDLPPLRVVTTVVDDEEDNPFAD